MSTQAGFTRCTWQNNILVAEQFTYGKAYLNFMSDVPLSNGYYADLNAVASDPGIRVLGQADLTNRRAHLWIDNVNDTWYNVVEGVAIPSISGTVTVNGLPDGVYSVVWWDTSSGQTTGTESVTCSGGALTLSVNNLQSDVGVKIYPSN